MQIFGACVHLMRLEAVMMFLITKQIKIKFD